MKLFICAVLFFFVQIMISNATSTLGSDCESRAQKVSVNFTQCCKYPPVAADDKELEEMAKALQKEIDPSKEPALFECMWSVKFFERFKLMDDKKEIDKAACTKFLGDAAKDTPFKDLTEKIINECYDETSKHAETWQKDSKIPKDKCMVKYDYMIDCVRIDMFAKCPKETFTKDEKVKEPCEFAHKFVNECQDDDKAIEIFVQGQTDV